MKEPKTLQELLDTGRHDLYASERQLRYLTRRYSVGLHCPWCNDLHSVITALEIDKETATRLPTKLEGVCPNTNKKVKLVTNLFNQDSWDVGEGEL